MIPRCNLAELRDKNQALKKKKKVTEQKGIKVTRG